MVIQIMTAAACLLGMGSALCTWLGRRLNAMDWFLRAENILMLQLVALAAGLLATACGLIGDIHHRRGLRACLKRIAWLAVMAAAWMIAAVYHVAVTGGV